MTKFQYKYIRTIFTQFDNKPLKKAIKQFAAENGYVVWEGRKVSWFSVNWNFLMSELTYTDKGEFNEKETSQLHA